MLDTSAGIIASPGVWLQHFEPLAGRRNAERWYIRMLMTIVSGSALLCDLSAPFEDSMPCFVKMRHGSFSQFGDQSLSVTHREALENSHAMLSSSGITRLKNLAWILQEVNTKGINGSFLEAGVWRGGSSIFSTAVMDLYQMERPIYLCDSFHGLPRPRAGSPRPDETQYQSMNRMGLAVGEKTVLRNFDVYSVPTRNVHTIPGYFVNSLPPLRDQLLQRGERLSVLRLDGDMYDSTMDSLYNLYDLVSVGGFIIIDDFIWSAGSSVQGTRLENRTMTTAFGAKDAVMDFRFVHGIEDAAHAIRDIDGMGAFWIKAKEVPVNRGLYLDAVKSASTKGYVALRPNPLLTGAHYVSTHKMWEEAQPPSRTVLGLRGFNKCKYTPGSETIVKTGYCGLCSSGLSSGRGHAPLGEADGRSRGRGDWE